MPTFSPRLAVIGLAASAVLLQGCTATMTETQRGTAMGAGVGALAGAVLGAATAGSNTSRSATQGAVVGAGLGALGGYIWSSRMEEQRRQLEVASQGTGIEVSRTADNRIQINIPSDAGFAVGRSDLSPALRRVLDQYAASLNNHAVTMVEIIGHTDSTGNDAINDPLSLARANTTRDYLVARGVSSQRIFTSGMGSRQPIASNASEAGRAMNRRVEIFVAESAR